MTELDKINEAIESYEGWVLDPYRFNGDLRLTGAEEKLCDSGEIINKALHFMQAVLEDDLVLAPRESTKQMRKMGYQPFISMVEPVIHIAYRAMIEARPISTAEKILKEE